MGTSLKIVKFIALRMHHESCQGKVKNPTRRNFGLTSYNRTQNYGLIKLFFNEFFQDSRNFHLDLTITMDK